MRVFPSIVGVLALAGCATHASPRTGDIEPATALAQAPAGADPSVSTGAPQFVIPVSGGAMLVAPPLGGSVFLPVDGGAPAVGFAASP